MTQRLVERLNGSNFLAVLGQSGSGKSSLVLAGLVPRLLDVEPGLEYLEMTPGDDPLARLEDLLSPTEGGKRLIVVNQFEELFTLCRQEAGRRAFLDRLLGLPRTTRVVVTMRADFWGDIAPYPALKDRMLAHQELIAPMDENELRAAIEEQAQTAGLRFDPGLVDLLLKDVRDAPGAMPLLQHALFELWNRRHGWWLRAARYREIGVQDAIGETASAVYRDLGPEDQERARTVFVRLTRVDKDWAPSDDRRDTRQRGERRDTRQRVALVDLVPAGSDDSATRQLVNRLADARLVVTTWNPTKKDRIEVEVAHEALIRHWSLLRGWLDEDRTSLLLHQNFSRAAKEWDGNDQKDSYLMHRGEHLEKVEALFKLPRFWPTKLEQTYQLRCDVLQQRERERPHEHQFKNIEDAGWGVIFAMNTDTAVRKALVPLLEHRRSEATRKNRAYFKEFRDKDGYRPKDTKWTFFQRHGVATGAPDPEVMPYYLLIVGDPESIPFSFQYDLDVEYAVGRLHFETVEEYARYAHSVVQAETLPLALDRRAVFFGPRNPDDPATERTSESLVAPLAEWASRDVEGWDIQVVLRDEATKQRLGRVLGGAETPALAFTASHGMGFPSEDPRQLSDQGALVCQDWPGPLKWGKPLSPEFYFTAGDVGDDARPFGMIAFLWSCFSGGTPHWDDYQAPSPQVRQAIAPQAFVARLPQRLLAHPNGGALAVIARVAQAGNTFFMVERVRRTLGFFNNTLKRLMEGYPVGLAMEYFNRRYSDLAAERNAQQNELRYGGASDDDKLKQMWSATIDARNYVILGDPAVRSMVREGAADGPPAP